MEALLVFFEMKKNQKTRRSSAQPTRTNLDLLQQLARAIATNERAQRRFRTAVLVSISKIQTTVQMVHGAQIAEAHEDSEGMLKHAKDAEEKISDASSKLGLAMVNFIYGESGDPSLRRGRKRQWSDWEI
jgi:hypothetical protein